MGLKVGVGFSHRSPILGSLMVIAAIVSGGLIISSCSALGNVNSVTVVNEGDYPWLVPGAYANYTALNIGPPFFITSTGQMLDGTSEAKGTPNNPVNGWLPGSGVASLNWTVASRDGNNVSLIVSFLAKGCQDNVTAYLAANQSIAPCTYYNYSTGVTVLVNLTTNEAYVGGVDQGALDFWSQPLLANTTLQSGSVIINGTIFPSMANISNVMPSSEVGWQVNGPPYVNVSGSLYKDTFPLYDAIGTTFSYNNANSSLGWLNSSATEVTGPNQTLIPRTSIGPTGFYDYYNGLAYQFSIPQFPLDETICRYDQPISYCSNVSNVSTTLGQYFRSADGFLQLTATNIVLGSNQQQSSESTFTSSSMQSILTGSEHSTSVQTSPLKNQSLSTYYLALEIAVPVAAALALVSFFFIARRKK